MVSITFSIRSQNDQLLAHDTQHAEDEAAAKEAIRALARDWSRRLGGERVKVEMFTASKEQI